MTEMINRTDVERWTAEYDKYYQRARAAFNGYEQSSTEASEAFEVADREKWVRLRDVADVYWRDRCRWMIYQDLARIRKYLAEFGFEFPGLVIPDELFD